MSSKARPALCQLVDNNDEPIMPRIMWKKVTQSNLCCLLLIVFLGRRFAARFDSDGFLRDVQSDLEQQLGGTLSARSDVIHKKTTCCRFDLAE
jgi:hypothetical protein